MSTGAEHLWAVRYAFHERFVLSFFPSLAPCGICSGNKLAKFSWLRESKARARALGDLRFNEVILCTLPLRRARANAKSFSQLVEEKFHCSHDVEQKGIGRLLHRRIFQFDLTPRSSLGTSQLFFRSLSP